MAIQHTVIRRMATATVRTAIHSMDGTIPGLGTVTVGMDIRTIGDLSVETELTKRAQTVLDLFLSFNRKRRKHKLLAQEQHRSHGYRSKTIRTKLPGEV